MISRIRSHSSVGTHRSRRSSSFSLSRQLVTFCLDGAVALLHCITHNQPIILPSATRFVPPLAELQRIV